MATFTVPIVVDQRLASQREDDLDPLFLHSLHESFDDAGVRELVERISFYQATKDGMDTSVLDRFRQGVEINTNRVRFINTSPKIWAGNLHHFVNVQAFGQALGFTQEDNTTQFKDVKKTWNPVDYIQNQLDSQMMLFNDGYQETYIASMEPLTIQGRKPTLDDPKNLLHKVAGEYGAQGTPIQQMMLRNSPDVWEHEDCRPRFDDSGAQGTIFAKSSYEAIPKNVFVGTWLSDVEGCLFPFNDCQEVHSVMNPLLQELTNPDPIIVSVLTSQYSNLDLDEDMLQTFEKRSATAGFQYENSTNARYGTDSIAFGGLRRRWSR